MSQIFIHILLLILPALLNAEADYVEPSRRSLSYYYAFDGCVDDTKGTGGQQVHEDAGWRDPTLTAEVVCCHTDGSGSTRYNPTTNACWSGNNDATEYTWQEAFDMCASENMRLCVDQDEINDSCNSGCMYDWDLVWSSLAGSLPTHTPTEPPTISTEFAYVDEGCISDSFDIGYTLKDSPHTIHLTLEPNACGADGVCFTDERLTEQQSTDCDTGFQMCDGFCYSHVYISSGTSADKTHVQYEALCNSLGATLAPFSECASLVCEEGILDLRPTVGLSGGYHCKIAPMEDETTIVAPWPAGPSTHNDNSSHKRHGMCIGDNTCAGYTQEEILRIGGESISLQGNCLVHKDNNLVETTFYVAARFCDTLSLVYDGSTYLAYCNGVYVQTLDISPNFQDSTLEVGMTQAYTGCVKEVYVWSRALNSEELPSPDQVKQGYCMHEKDPWADDAESTIILYQTEKECQDICDEDYAFRACTHHAEPNTCIAYTATNGNFTGSGDDGFTCYLSKTGSIDDTNNEVAFQLYEGSIHDQTGDRTCIQRHDFDVLRTFGTSAHTIYVEVWFGDGDPVNDEIMVNLGHETQGGQLWVWGLNAAGERVIRFGTYGNLPIEVTESDCADLHAGYQSGNQLLLTTTFENNYLTLYCDGNFVDGAQIELNIARKKYAIGEISIDIGLEPFDDGCVVASQIWSRVLTLDEIRDISEPSVTRPSKTPSVSPSAKPTISLVYSELHDCNLIEGKSYNFGSRILGNHPFTIHITVDLLAESRLASKGTTGYTMTLGPRDTAGSFYWDWDDAEENNLIFGVVGSQSVSVDVWGCQFIAATYVSSYVKIFCDYNQAAELYVFDDMDITSSDLYIGGHPFGRCITNLELRSWEMTTADQNLAFNSRYTTTFQPSGAPSMAPVPAIALDRIFDNSHYDDNIAQDCITSTEIMYVTDHEYDIGTQYTIHVQTKLDNPDIPFFEETLLTVGGSIYFNWNHNDNQVFVRDSSGTAYVSSVVHTGLLCEHFTVVFYLVATGFQDMVIWCESQKIPLTSLTSLVPFSWPSATGSLSLQVGDYPDFCAKEVEMWERPLLDEEIKIIAQFPELNFTLSECNRACGPGVQIRTATGCSSYYWGCEHLDGAIATPIECEEGVCQNLDEDRQDGYLLTNQAAVDSTDCIELEGACSDADGDACADDVTIECDNSDTCIGYSITQAADGDGEVATYKLFNDAECMAENTIYDFTTSIFMESPGDCEVEGLAQFLSTLRLLTFDGFDYSSWTLGAEILTTLNFGPFDSFTIKATVDCLGTDWAVGFEFPDENAKPQVGNTLYLDSIAYDDGAQALSAAVTLEFEGTTVQFEGTIGASEFSMAVVADTDYFEIISGISVTGLELTLAPGLIRAAGVFDFSGVVASTEMSCEDDVWTITASTDTSASGPVTFGGDALEVDDLGIVFTKEGSEWNLEATLGGARINILGQTFEITGTIAYDSASSDYQISASIADSSPIEIYGASISSVSILYASGTAAVQCGESVDTSSAVSGGFIAEVKGTFSYDFEDETFSLTVWAAYSGGNWMASGTFGDDSSSDVKIFNNLYLVTASVCTEVRTGEEPVINVEGTLRWDYDNSRSFLVTGSLKYDGKYFDAMLTVGDSAFDMPDPFESGGVDFTAATIAYSGESQEVSAQLSLIMDNGWDVYVAIDVSEDEKAFEIGFASAWLSDFFEWFDSNIEDEMPDDVWDFLSSSTVGGSLSWSDADGFQGDLSFTTGNTNPISLNFWFMYKPDSTATDKFAFLVQFETINDLGNDGSGTVSNLAGTSSTNVFMMGYSNFQIDAADGPTELGTTEFPDGLEIPAGASVQVYIDTRPPTDGSADERKGIVKFIHDQLKITEVVMSLAVASGDFGVDFKLAMGVEWSFWEFDIYRVDMLIQAGTAELSVNIGVEAWCHLASPAIMAYGDMTFAFKNGNFELGVGLGFEGTIYDAFGVDGLMLSDVAFEGTIATLPSFPFVQPKGLYIHGTGCIDDDTCLSMMAFFSSSAPSAFYFAASGENWYMSDIIAWRMPNVKNKNLLNKIGFASFDLEVGAALSGVLTSDTVFERLDGSAVEKLDGSVLQMDGPFFRIDIADFDFGIISGSRFLVDLTLGKNPKLITEIDLNEVNLGLFRIRDGKCRSGTGPRMYLEAWKGHFYLEAEGSVYKWNNCIGMSATVSKTEIEGCIHLTLKIKLKYPSCKCKWKGWKLKCSCSIKTKYVTIKESLCAKVAIASSGRRRLSTDEDWVPQTSDLGAELWELRQEIYKKNGARIKVIHDTLTEFNGVYADETGEEFMGFPVYRRLDNSNQIIHKFCMVEVACPTDEDLPADARCCNDEPLDIAWILVDASTPSYDNSHYSSIADPRSTENDDLDQDYPWRTYWDSSNVRWMSDFGSTEISFQDRAVYKYMGEMRNGAPLYRNLEQPELILFEGEDDGDELIGVTGRWVIAQQTEDSEGVEIITPRILSDVMAEEDMGPWETSWSEANFDNDFRHSLNSRVWSGTDLTEVPFNQWKEAIHIEGRNGAFSYEGEAWDQTEKYENDGSRIDPGYYRYPVQAIKISMNGVDRYFKLYLSDDQYKWPGFSGYTLKDLLTTDIAQNTEDGVFYEQHEEDTNDLWRLWTNETVEGFPTPAPTMSSDAWPSHGEYCVNGGSLPALDVNVNNDHEGVYGRIVIRRASSPDHCDDGYEGIGLAGNVSAGYYASSGLDDEHQILRATVYVLPLPSACEAFCPSGHLVENDQGHWICEDDVEGEIYCDCNTYLDVDVCAECPENMWVGDSHHALTRCFPERCADECDDGYHLAYVNVSSVCEEHEDSTLTVDDSDVCFTTEEWEMEYQCVETTTETVCDCDSYLASDGTCVLCTSDTWVGKSAHTLDDTHCLPMRLGSVDHIGTYTMAKGYAGDDEPNILELIEETTHIEMTESEYIDYEFKINGDRAQELFGNVDALYDWTAAEQAFAAISAEVEVAYSKIVDHQHFAGEDQYLHYFTAFYTKEKEVGYLSMQLDDLVDKCVKHQMWCFVLNLVHREMMASQYQLRALKDFTDNVVTGNLKVSATINPNEGISDLFENYGVNITKLAEYQERKAELVVARAYKLIEEATWMTEIFSGELLTELTEAEDPRVSVYEMEIPSSSFSDSERTEYYPIHGKLNFVGMNMTFDIQKKYDTTSEGAQDATESMMHDLRRDLMVQYIRDYWAEQAGYPDCTAEPQERMLIYSALTFSPDYQTRDFVTNPSGCTADFSAGETCLEWYDPIACTLPPHLYADRYQSNWELWHYQKEEYVYVARANGAWDIQATSVIGEMLLDDAELEELKNINTLSEMSTGAYCTPEARAPVSSWTECCSGLKINPETGLCETPCTLAGEEPWVLGTLVPCCYDDDSPIYDGSKYVCGHPDCAGEYEFYSDTLPCCDGYTESEIILSSGENSKVCVLQPDTDGDVAQSAAPIYYRNVGCEDVMIEAENLQMSGGASADNAIHGYAFEGYITFSDPEYDSARFKLRGVSGQGILSIRYYSESNADMEVLVNGVSHYVNLSYTGGEWDRTEVTVDFDSDNTFENEVEIRPLLAESFTSPFIDLFEVSDACSYGSDDIVWDEYKGDTCNNNRQMICNNGVDSTCTLDYCKNYARINHFHWFTYSNTRWCIMCHEDANGNLIDDDDTNSGYTLYHTTAVFGTDYHYVGTGYCRAEGCAAGDECRIKGYFRQIAFDSSLDFDTVPSTRRQRYAREPNMYVSSYDECEAECTRNDDCIGFSLADDDYEFPGRCIIHVIDLADMPAIGWREADHTSIQIDTTSLDEGVSCYSKIVECVPSCAGTLYYVDCDGDSILDPLCIDANGFETQLSTRACQVSTTCEIDATTSLNYRDDSSCIVPYGVEDLQDNVNAYCAGEEYTQNRVEPTACDAFEQTSVELALANAMFKSCSDECIYDVYDPENKAYVYEGTYDDGCWKRVDKDASLVSQDCYSGSDYAEEIDFAVSRVKYFCEGTFECKSLTCDQTNYVENTDYIISTDDELTCFDTCKNDPTFDCGTIEITTAGCVLWKTDICTTETAGPSHDSFLCSQISYLPEIKAPIEGTVMINFQPDDVATPSGYLKDSGGVYQVHDSGLTYGWGCDDMCGDEHASCRDRNDAGTVESTLIIPDRHMGCDDDNWKILVGNGEYHVEIGYMDDNWEGETSGCKVNDISISVGTTAAGEHQTISSNVIVQDGYITLSGTYDDSLNERCTHYNYIHITNGFKDMGYEMGVTSTAECSEGYSIVENEDDCIAASRSIGLRYYTTVSSTSVPMGCSYYDVTDVLVFNTATSGTPHDDHTVVCKSDFTLLFRQTLPNLYTSGEWSSNKFDPHSGKYSILDEIEDYRSYDGRFYFTLKYPDQGMSQVWSQTSNPTSETIDGYEPIITGSISEYWGGLEADATGRTLMDGSVGQPQWFYAVGSFLTWYSSVSLTTGIPSAKWIGAVDTVELYVTKNYVPAFALIDGAPSGGTNVADIVDPDPASAIGEIQCCSTTYNTCTRSDPATSTVNTNCMSGTTSNDGKVTLYDALEACANLGEDWRLCTREETESDMCQGAGCNIDYTWAWVLDPCIGDEYNPDDYTRTYSSITSAVRSMLDSPAAWTAATTVVGSEWMQIDLQSVMQISGVVTQGRGNQDTWVTGFTVSFSEDGSTYQDIGETFVGNSDRDTRVENVFARGSVMARYVRFYATTFYGLISMRAGVLTQPCASQTSSSQSSASSSQLSATIEQAVSQSLADSEEKSSKSSASIEEEESKYSSAASLSLASEDLETSNVDRFRNGLAFVGIMTMIFGILRASCTCYHNKHSAYNHVPEEEEI